MLKKIRSTASRAACLSFVSSLALVGCGGDSGPAAPDVPPPTVLSLSGTVAQGAAMASAVVTIKCASGTASVTAGADGKYATTLTSGSLPCVMKAVSADGTRTYHSALAGSGAATASYTVNVTPLTDLLVATAAGAQPDSYFTNFGATTTLAPATMTQAATQLTTVLAGVVDLAGVDPVSDPLVAASGATAGNALDQKLDALAAALAKAGTTQATLVSAIAANPGAADPVKILVQPAATGCAWLHSGKFRMISPFEKDPAWRAHVMQVDATTLTATTFDGAQATLTPDADNACAYTVPGDNQDTVKFMVTAAGILVGLSGGTVPLTIGLPEQTLPLSELAGTWSSLRDESSVMFTEITVDTQGQVTAFAECPGGTCTAGAPPYSKFQVDANGGFDVVDASGITDRLYLFKTANGDRMVMTVSSDGHDFNIATIKKPTAMPTVGTTTKYWDLAFTRTGPAGARVANTQTFLSADTTAQSYTRQLASSDPAQDRRIDTFTINQPRDGMRTRAVGGCTIDGVATNCAGVTTLPFPSMGLTLYAVSSSTTRVGVSVGRPN